MSFAHLGLTPELLHAVADQGYTVPTPVQDATIPLVLAGRDVRAAAQTGTGKTAAFVLPILQVLHATRHQAPMQGTAAPARRIPVRTLILVPTRELAVQVEESVRVYGARRPVRSAVIYGGVGFDAQARALRVGAEVVVATPGRLLDHVSQRTIDLSRVEILVLDEADRMLDMGFIRDIRKILALLPPRRQNLLFSATFSDEMRNLADRLLDNPASVEVARRNTPAELVRQVVHPVDRERKRELLSRLIRTGQVRQALVFTRTKHGANRLAEQLVRDGIAATAIHGNKSQPQRMRALDDFKAGRADVMVATDIAARGLDIDALPHVVNYELPMVAQDYVHRIGRTGRAGADGIALSLVCVDETKLLREIEILLGRKIETEVVTGFAPDASIRPEAVRLRSTPAERARSVAPRASATVSAPGRSSAGRPQAGRPQPVRVPAGRRQSVRPQDGRPQHGRTPAGALPAGATIGRLVEARPPWARDAGRIDGQRVSAGDLRTLPGERIARMAEADRTARR
jgi:ATP-dependent RNA helicase RhlE